MRPGPSRPGWAFVALLASLASGCTIPIALSPPTATPAAESVPPVQASIAQPVQPAPEPAPVVAAPVGDLWQRVQEGLALERPRKPDVAREIAWLSRHPRYLERISGNARPLLHHVMEHVERRGMPVEVALLPIIESGYQPGVYSPNRAAGIWQFIPGTGRRYGLRQDHWYDGRRDLVASTAAALDYLGALHERFGDWHLAFAAYNCGELTIERARSRNRHRGRPTDFWSLDLPKETRIFLPRLLAVAEVISDPARYGQRLQAIPDAPYFVGVEVAGRVALRDVARLAGVPHEEIAVLNAAHLRGVTAPGGPHRLLVPVAHAEPLRVALAASPPPSSHPERHHRIADGETLGGIAARYGTSVEALRAANGLRGNAIRAGRDLVIPGETSNPPALAAAGRAADQPGPAASKTGAVHVVGPGDSLWEIARMHDLRVGELAAWNGLHRGSVLHLGQRLKLHPPADPGPALAAQLSPAAPEGDRRQLSYRVRSGDSLWKIARQFDVRVEDLLRWNNLPRRAKLQPGQELLIFVLAGNPDDRQPA